VSSSLYEGERGPKLHLGQQILAGRGRGRGDSGGGRGGGEGAGVEVDSEGQGGGGQHHGRYSEQLVQFNGTGFYFFRPNGTAALAEAR
jgi:hypothetical protein